MGIETNAGSRLEKLSAAALPPGENPYAAFIAACHDDPVRQAIFPCKPSFPVAMTDVSVDRDPAALLCAPYETECSAKGEIPRLRL